MSVVNFVDPSDLVVDTSVNTLDLTGELMKQAALFAHYGSLAAKAQHQEDRYKLMVETVEAKLDREIRDKAAVTGAKMTEAQIAKEICRRREYVEMVSLLNEAKMVNKLCYAAMESLRHKRDALVQLAVTAREEAKGEMRIMERNEDAIRERRERVLANMQHGRSPRNDD